MRWEDSIINEVCIVGDGAHASIKRQESGILYLTSKNFKATGLDLSKTDYISIEDFLKHFKDDSKALTKPKYNDIILGIIGSLGAPYLVKENDNFGISSSVSILRPNDKILDSKYLYYWIRSNEFQFAIHQIKSGVAQSFLSLSMIRSLPVRFPIALPTQKKIASILSAYDDLIENNLKRIKLLEEAAQNIYKEWFVNFRFPGWENAKFDKESGLPEGWRIQDASLICDIKIGKTPPRKESKWFSKSEGTKWCSISDMNQSTIFLLETKERITNDGVSIFNMNLAGKGTVILSFKLTIGAVAITSEDIVTNEAIAHFNIKPNESITKEFIYCYLKNFNFDILGSTSSIGMALNSNIVKAMPILNPNMKIIETFTRSTSNIFSQINNLLLQNQKLKEARDILLPRLMNQTIEV